MTQQQKWSSLGDFHALTLREDVWCIASGSKPNGLYNAAISAIEYSLQRAFTDVAPPQYDVPVNFCISSSFWVDVVMYSNNHERFLDQEYIVN